MSRLVINLNALKHNVSAVDRWMGVHNAHWIAVTKALCGHDGMLQAMRLMGVPAIGDSRLSNLSVAGEVIPDVDRWYLRGPLPSAIDQVVRQSDVSLNSEIAIIEQLNAAAGKIGRQHGVVIMVELGDLREGILPGGLVNFYQHVFELPNIKVLGIGGNLGCLAGVVPTIDQVMQLVLYRELLELKFEHKLPLISAGTTAMLPLMLSGQLPDAVNHFRIGEALLLGTDLINGGTLQFLRDDVFILEAEISEIKEKGLVPLAETAPMSRVAMGGDEDEPTSPGQRGYRALVNVGHLDTDIGGLTPEDGNFRIAGGSSDITVVNVGETATGLKVGDELRFKVNYPALIRLMSSKYIDKVFDPPLADFADEHMDRSLGIRSAGIRPRNASPGRIGSRLDRERGDQTDAGEAIPVGRR